MLTFTLKYFMENNEWRVSGFDDQYWTASSIDDIPRCVRSLMRYTADTIETLAIEPATK
jgi:hypothetical protein